MEVLNVRGKDGKRVAVIRFHATNFMLKILKNSTNLSRGSIVKVGMMKMTEGMTLAMTWQQKRE